MICGWSWGPDVFCTEQLVQLVVHQNTGAILYDAQVKDFWDAASEADGHEPRDAGCSLPEGI